MKDNSSEQKYVKCSWMGGYDKIHIDPIVLEIMELSFEHANEQGLLGIKVSDLKLVTKNKNPNDPLDNDIWAASFKKYVSDEEYDRVKKETDERWKRWVAEPWHSTRFLVTEVPYEMD